MCPNGKCVTKDHQAHFYKGGKMTKASDVKIATSVSRQVYAQIKKQAELEGVSIYQWLRNIILDALINHT